MVDEIIDLSDIEEEDNKKTKKVLSSTKPITKPVTKQVTKQVTKPVTKQVTKPIVQSAKSTTAEIINNSSAPLETAVMDDNDLFDDMSFASSSSKHWSIKIIGIGGAGTNIASYIKQKLDLPKEVKIAACNTDRKSLLKNYNISKINAIVLDEKNLKGNGSGGDPRIGAAATINEINKIKKFITGADILIVIAGLGKGTGSGGSPEILKVAKEMGIITISIVTIPSPADEGEEVYKNARISLKQIMEYTTTSFIVDNERLVGNDKNSTLLSQHEKSNDEVKNIVANIVDIIDGEESNINIDLADLKNFFRKYNCLHHISIKIEKENYDQSKLNNYLTLCLEKSSLTNDFSSGKICGIINTKVNKDTPSMLMSWINKSLLDIAKNRYDKECKVDRMIYGQGNWDKNYTYISLILNCNVESLFVQGFVPNTNDQEIIEPVVDLEKLCDIDIDDTSKKKTKKIKD